MARPLDAKERRAQHEAREFAERYGAPVARGPVAPAAAKPEPMAKRAGKGILSWFKTAAITLGVFWVIGFGLVTWFTTSRMSERWRPIGMSPQFVVAQAASEPWLALRLPPDPSITPEAAGTALQSIWSRTARAAFPGVRVKAVEPPPIPWRGIPLRVDLFSPDKSSPASVTGLPRSAEFLTLMRDPMTADQRAALRVVGSAEVWATFDRVARAPLVDIVGTRFELPFGDEARGWFVSMATAGFFSLRDFGHASYMRAGWHLSEGRRDSAEFALRALLSFGQALTENGSSLAEQQIGASLARAGSDGLDRFFEILGDPRGKPLAEASALAEKAAADNPVYRQLPRGDLPQAQRQLMAMLKAPTTTHAMKLELMRSLEATACGTVRGAFTGPSGEVRAALDAARRDYVRVPSDATLLELLDREMSRPFPSGGQWGPLGGIGQVVARVYFSPRLGTCSIYAIGGFGSLR